MSDSESSSLYDISGFVFGLLGLLGTVQIFCIIIFYYFPKRRLHGLETTYAEAYFLYHCGVQERILDADMQRIEEKLRWTRAEINEVHSEVFCLGSFWRQVLSIVGRLSQKFRDLDVAVKELCADIASSSQKGRRNLAASGQCYKPCISPMMSPALMQPGRSAEQPCIFHDLSHSRHCVFTPHQYPTQGAEPDLPRIDASHSPSASAQRVPVHKESICSVSTTSTAVDAYAPTQAQAAITNAQPERLLRYVELHDHSTQPKASTMGYADKPSPLPDDLSKTTDSTTIIDDRYKDVKCLLELLLSKLHYLPELRRDPEEMDISDGSSSFESYISKLQQGWKRSPTPPILPL